MFQMEKALLKLLQGEVFIDNGKRRVPVITRTYPTDGTPCITIQQSKSSTNNDTRRIRHNPREYIELRRNATVSVGLYANSVEQMQELQDAVDLIIFEAYSNSYKRCKHYNRVDKSCDTLSTEEDRVECEVLTVTNRFTAKGQCPNKEANDYCSFFKQNNIIKNTFVMEPATHIDEYDVMPPIYHVELNFEMDYYTIYDVGGAVSSDFKLNIK